eukprot:6162713-Alexandrium_andersonii.AAC.1
MALPRGHHPPSDVLDAQLAMMPDPPDPVLTDVDLDAAEAAGVASGPAAHASNSHGSSDSESSSIGSSSDASTSSSSTSA